MFFFLLERRLPFYFSAFECGTIPSFYLPSGVDYSSPFFASIKPGSVGPFNDTRTTVSPRIIQGEAANIAQYPWQVHYFSYIS